PMWRLNPRGHRGLLAIGPWAVVLMVVVSGACAAAAIGLWRRTRWGYRLAVAGLTGNLLGDLGTGTFRPHQRTLIGVPLVGAIAGYRLLPGTRRQFASLDTRSIA